MRELVTLADVRQAADHISGMTLRTPLVRYPEARQDRPLLVKSESLQPTGAFKLRGAANALAALSPAERGRGVVTHSSGNHAQALAYAARHWGRVR